MTVSSFAAALCDIWRAYVPIPRPFLAQLWGVKRQLWLGHVPIPRPFLHWMRLIWGSNFLLDPEPQNLAWGVALSLGLLAMSAWTLRRSPMAIVWYMFGTGLMFVFHFVLSGAAVRHDGLYLILYLACFWCALTSTRDPTPQSLPGSLPARKERCFLSTILVVQVIAGAYAWTLHLGMPFSASKLAADFIRQQGYGNLLIIGSNELYVSPVTAYLDQPIYYPDSGRFGTYSCETTARHNLSKNEFLLSAAQMAMKTNSDTLLVVKGRFAILDDGVIRDLKGGAWLRADGSLFSPSKPPTEPCMKIWLLADFRPVIVDEEYSLYLIRQR
jgi:hypothetical protein